MYSLNSVFHNKFLLIIFLCFLLFASYSDIKKQLIYDKFNLIMFSVRIFTFFILGFQIKYIFGAIFMFLILLFAGVIVNKPMGGDIKFCGNIGLWLGFYDAAVVLFISLILNLIFRKITKNTNPMALAPFLLVSFIIILFVKRCFLFLYFI